MNSIFAWPIFFDEFFEPHFHLCTLTVEIDMDAEPCQTVIREYRRSRIGSIEKSEERNRIARSLTAESTSVVLAIHPRYPHPNAWRA